MSGSDGPIVRKSFAFAVRIINLYKALNERHREYHLGKQLLRCGTSIGAHIRESQNAESRLDFIHKMAIALKEASEAMYWLELLKVAEYLSQSEFNSMITDAIEIQKILRSIILTCKKKPRANPTNGDSPPLKV